MYNVLNVRTTLQAIQCHATELNEDEYVGKTIKDNAPGLVSHMIGGGGMNLKKLAVKTEMAPLKIDDFVPNTVQTQAEDSKKTVVETTSNVVANGQEVAQSAAQKVQDQIVAGTDQTVQQQQNASNDEKTETPKTE